ncbi:hypothetical protein [Bacillus sp. UMB0893]|nr:hypothetical protein [Bacillus sp. UMB0893]
MVPWKPGKAKSMSPFKQNVGIGMVDKSKNESIKSKVSQSKGKTGT